MRGSMWYHNHSTVVDTGRNAPKFFQFRKQNLILNISELSNLSLSISDDVLIDMSSGEPIIKIGKNSFEDVDIKSGVVWYRRDYDWYGFQFDRDVIKLIIHFKRICKWLHTQNEMKKMEMPSWVYLIYSGENNKIPIAYEDIPTIINKLRYDKIGNASLYFGFCIYDKYAYFGNNLWGNGSGTIPKKEMIKKLNSSIAHYEKIRNKYNAAMVGIREIG